MYEFPLFPSLPSGAPAMLYCSFRLADDELSVSPSDELFAFLIPLPSRWITQSRRKEIVVERRHHIYVANVERASRYTHELVRGAQWATSKWSYSIMEVTFCPRWKLRYLLLGFIFLLLETKNFPSSFISCEFALCALAWAFLHTSAKPRALSNCRGAKIFQRNFFEYS